MNRIVIILLLLVSLAGCHGGNGKGNDAETIVSANTEIVFTEYEHDFGPVEAGEKVSYTFTFENRGPEDLIIASANTTCGCTVPRFDSRPVKAGDKGNLEVVFDTSGRQGLQSKTVSVHSNAKVPVVLLKITAYVIASK